MSGSITGAVQIPGYNPSQNRVPGAYAVVDATKANSAQEAQRTLLIGQMLGTGSATPNVAVLSAGIGDAQSSFGAGSQLAIAVERYRALDPNGELWCLPIADAGVVLNTSAVQAGPSATLQFAPETVGDVLPGETVSGTDIAVGTVVAPGGVNWETGAITLSQATTSAVASGTAITFGGSSKAAGSIAFTGTATANGTIPLYVDFHYIPVNVNSGDTAAMIATNAAAAINAWSSAGGNPLSYVASAATGTLTFTARHGGTLGNEGVIALSWHGTAAGEGQLGSPNVPGITAVITGFSGGATDPSLTTAIANLPAQTFDFICVPYNDTNSLAAITAFLSDSSGRWLWSTELFGGAFTAKNGTFSARTTWGTALNDQHLSGIGAYNAPNPDWHWAVDYCAAAAVSLRANPAVPVGGLGGGVALNVGAPQLKDRDIFDEWNTLLFDGVSPYTVDSSGLVRVKRAITTYQKNPGGAPDNSYLDVNVPYQLAAFIRAWRTMILSSFNQVILVADGSRIPPGSRMVMPSTIKFATVALYRQLADSGLVQNPDQFARQIQSTNAGRGQLTMLLPVQLSNQLIAVAADVQFTQP